MRRLSATFLLVTLAACGRANSYSFDPTAEAEASQAQVAPSILRVRARGSSAGDVYPSMRVSIDGVVVSTVSVTEDYASYDFTLPKAATDVGKVGVRFMNDAVIDGDDRNLEIGWIKLGALTVKPTEASVSYDRYNEDGKDVIAGRVRMAWTGTLIFAFTPVGDDGGDDPVQPVAVCDTASTAGADKHTGIDPTACAFDTSCNGVLISAGSTAAAIQRQLDAQPEGTTFCFAAGMYRLEATLYPKQGNKLIGAPGARFNGSSPVPAASISKQGTVWVASNIADPLPVTGPAECLDESTLCLDQTQAYVGDKFLVRVATRAQVTTGKYFIDHAANQVVVADDPTSVGMEVTRTDFAIWGGGSEGGATTNDVTVQGLIIEKYGSAGQRGAVYAENGKNWKVLHNTIRHNHGLGLATGSGMLIRCNDIRYNGEMGVGGVGTGVVFENNELAYNNAALYNYGWEGGGVKFAVSDGLVVRSNWVHHNIGPGLWTDIDNVNVTIQNNLTEDNVGPGIFHEISFKAVIGHNTSRRNGLEEPWYWGAGILLAASQDVEVCANHIESNGTGIMLIDQGRGASETTGREYMVANDYVHDNLVIGDQGMGALEDYDDDAIFSRNNRFERNTYRFETTGDDWFQWNDESYTFDAWKALGLDAGATMQAL